MSGMDVRTAYSIVRGQNERIRALHGKRFVHKGYEYEVRYEGGFATMVSLYRRQVGKRNFKWFTTEGCYDCLGAATAFEKICRRLP